MTHPWCRRDVRQAGRRGAGQCQCGGAGRVHADPQRQVRMHRAQHSSRPICTAPAHLPCGAAAWSVRMCWSTLGRPSAPHSTSSVCGCRVAAAPSSASLNEDGHQGAGCGGVQRRYGQCEDQRPRRTQLQRRRHASPDQPCNDLRLPAMHQQGTSTQDGTPTSGRYPTRNRTSHPPSSPWALGVMCSCGAWGRGSVRDAANNGAELEQLRDHHDHGIVELRDDDVGLGAADLDCCLDGV